MNDKILAIIMICFLLFKPDDIKAQTGEPIACPMNINEINEATLLTLNCNFSSRKGTPQSPPKITTGENVTPLYRSNHRFERLKITCFKSEKDTVSFIAFL